MSVQISTRVDETTKEQFDRVCESIGITPSNAISMFIKGVINYNGIPFNVIAPPREQPSDDTNIRAAIARRKAGEKFLTSEEFLANMQLAIDEGIAYARED